MAGIGGVTCDFVHGGPVADLKTRLEIWQVPGISGYGAMDLGLGDSGFLFVGVKYGTSGQIQTWATGIAAVQGQVVSIVDELFTYSNLLLVRVGKARWRPAKGNGYDLRAEIAVAGVVSS